MRARRTSHFEIFESAELRSKPLDFSIEPDHAAGVFTGSQVVEFYTEGRYLHLS